MTRPRIAVLTLLVMSVAVLPVLPLWLVPAGAATATASLIHALSLGAGVTAFLRVPAGQGHLRRSRRLFAAALGVVALALVVQAGYVVIEGSVPFPSWVDVIAPLWVPLVMVGLWVLPSRDEEMWSRRRFRVDAALAGAALLVISWLLVVRPISQSTVASPIGQAVQTAYPLFDVVVAAMTVAVLPRVREDAKVFLNFCALGLLFMAISDSGITLLVAREGALTFGWADVAFQVGIGLLITGGLVRPAIRRRPRSPRAALYDDLVAYAPVSAAVVVLVAYASTGHRLTAAEALFGALMVSVLITRQLLLDHQLRQTAERHRYAALHDALTGLENRKAFVGRLHTMLRANQPMTSAAVLFADLNGFKEINDTLGHDVGDQVLRAFADQLRAYAGDHAVARLGGDEFACLVVAEQPVLTAEILAAGLVRMEPDFDRPFAVTASVGIAALQADDHTPGDVLRRADLAMYSAKRSRQQQIATYEPSMTLLFERHQLLLAQLPRAIDQGEMTLVYQPLYRIGEGSLVAAEALLRWNHPVLGAVPPDEFIRLAEDSGEILAIGSWVVEQAVAQVAAWERGGRYLPRLLVNLGVPQFTDALPAFVLQVLARHQIAPDRLVLEVTESEIAAPAVSLQADRLRQAGVRIALDDFGSGYSSLAQLATLPVDILKIDRGFILTLSAESGRQVLDAVAALARSLGLESVAEGIETPRQATAVRDAGIDLVQGFLFSRPLPPEELATHLVVSREVS